MAYFKIQDPNQPITKWIKNVDRANGTLEFSTDRDGCYQQDSGFFADSELAYLKFHFKKKYPEIEYLTIDNDYHGHYDGAIPQVMADTPNEPMGEEEHAMWDVAANDEPIAVVGHAPWEF